MYLATLQLLKKRQTQLDLVVLWRKKEKRAVWERHVLSFSIIINSLAITKNSDVTNYTMTYRVGLRSPGELFSSGFRACARKLRWATRCSFGLIKVSCSCNAATRSAVRKWALPLASSPLSDQRRTWLLFAEQIEIFQVNAWLATFKARTQI